MKQKSKTLGQELCFNSPIPLFFYGSVQAEMPWQKLFSMPASVKGEEGDFPEQLWREVYMCGYMCGGEGAEDKKEKKKQMQILVQCSH